MNIFVLDSDPIIAAQYCIDRHVVKMPTESAQMLANAYNNLDKAPKRKDGLVYKGGWANHPCSKWVLESLDNFDWLVSHGLALCSEKLIRWPNNDYHFCEQFLLWAKFNRPDLPSKGLTRFAMALPKELYNDDPVQAYRNYYIKCKRFDKSGKNMAKWTNRSIPSWFKE